MKLDVPTTSPWFTGREGPHIPRGCKGWERPLYLFCTSLYSCVFFFPPPHTAYTPVGCNFPSTCVEWGYTSANHHCQCNFLKYTCIYWGCLYISVRRENLHWTPTAYICDYLTSSKHCYLERWSTLNHIIGSVPWHSRQPPEVARCGNRHCRYFSNCFWCHQLMLYIESLSFRTL